MNKTTTLGISNNGTEEQAQTDELLVIPPDFIYPDRYELTTVIPGVGKILVRPIRQGDTAMFEALFESMTPHSVYLRFFSFLRQLPPQMLQRFTDIDYDQEIALVALLTEGGRASMIGDARVVHTLKPGCAEFSVMVADQWQGKGVGACLLQHCLALAARRGFKNIHGIVLAENKNMLALGRKLDFAIRHVPGSSEYELTKTMA